MIKSLVALYQTAICERCTEEHNRLFEGFNNYRYSIKIFSITFCTLLRRKVNLSVCKPMKGMKILSKCKLQYLPMEGLVFVWPNVIQGT